MSTARVSHVFGRDHHDFTETTFTGSLLFRSTPDGHAHFIAGGGAGLLRAHTDADEPGFRIDRTETIQLLHGRIGAEWDISSRLVIRTEGVLWFGDGLDWVLGARAGVRLSLLTRNLPSLGPPGCALAEEGVHPFLAVLGEEVAGDRVSGDGVRLVERQLELAVEDRLAGRDRAGGLAAISLAMALTSASSVSAGTTRLTSPISCARAALIGAPVSSISMACLRPTARPNATPGVEQNAPMLTPGVAKVADSEATARSQVATS